MTDLTPERRGVIAAGFWHRALAFAVDLPVVALLVVALGSVSGLLDWGAWPERRWNLIDHVVDIVNAQSANLIGLAMLAASVGALYGLVSERLIGGTPGKRALGLRVVNRYGERPGALALLVRNVVKVVSLGTLGLGALWQAVDMDKRALHDRLGGTHVIRGMARTGADRGRAFSAA